jgi:hypothetical protein
MILYLGRLADRRRGEHPIPTRALQELANGRVFPATVAADAPRKGTSTVSPLGGLVLSSPRNAEEC